MDTTQFDRLTRVCSHLMSRRGLAGALGLTVATLPGLTAAKKKHRKRKKAKLQLNAFGCVNVGNACRGNDDNCCSGICEGNTPKKGKKDRSRCIAHDEADCLPAVDICEGISPICGDAGACFRTTGNASFCGALDLKCVACTRDNDCEGLFGSGAACVVCSTCGETNGTTCRSSAIAGD
jgi:hypothetical protein